MFKKKLAIIGAALLAVCMGLACLTACNDGPFKGLLDPDDPVKITVWTYYNDDQTNAFNNLVDKFNNTVGDEKGIVVEAKSQSKVNNVPAALIDSVDKKSGAQELPNMAAVYSETAFILEQKNALASLDEYFTEDELKEYIPAYIEEGRLRENSPLYLMPISKSTEVVAYNATDWAPFEKATGRKISDIESIEDMVAAAAEYYEWSGGKALYGRDSLENYVYVSTAQLGHEMFKVGSDGKPVVDLDRETFRSLWDNYYVPMINGHFLGTTGFATGMVTTGDVLALTCSTSAMTYFPTEVVDLHNDNAHAIEAVVTKPLLFENRVKDVYVQQGAAYCVLKTTKAEEYASALFLKWFTEKEQNIDFAVMSSYCPAKISANDPEDIKKAFGTVDDVKSRNVLASLTVSSKLLSSGNSYACKPFDGAKEVRAYLGTALENTTNDDVAKIAAAVVKSKVTKEEAIKQYSTDFDKWFEEVKTQVNALIK